jgi:hypothetical protein
MIPSRFSGRKQDKLLANSRHDGDKETLQRTYKDAWVSEMFQAVLAEPGLTEANEDNGGQGARV